MSKKRTIEEIIESIFQLVNEANNKGNEISYESSKKISKFSENINSSENEIKKMVVADKTLETKNENNLKKKEYSDWTNIKFNNKIDTKNIEIKTTITSLIEKKINAKFKSEIQKWVEKKMPRLLEIEMKKKTRIAYKND